MDSKKILEAEKADLSEDFSEDAKLATQTSYDAGNNLSNNLITITLAFVALISVEISSGEILDKLTFDESLMIFSSIIFFALSIIAGLLNYFASMRFHQRAALIRAAAADRAERADSVAELKRIHRSTRSVHQSKHHFRSNTLLLTQIILMLAGLALTIMFVAMLLF